MIDNVLAHSWRATPDKCFVLYEEASRQIAASDLWTFPKALREWTLAVCYWLQVESMLDLLFWMIVSFSLEIRRFAKERHPAWIAECDTPCKPKSTWAVWREPLKVASDRSIADTDSHYHLKRSEKLLGFRIWSFRLSSNKWPMDLSRKESEIHK